MMRWLIAVCLMTACWTAPNGIAYGAAKEVASARRVVIGSEFLYAADARGVWIVQGDQVFYAEAEKDYPLKPVAEVKDIASITSMDDCLYILTGSDMERSIVKLDKTGEQRSWRVSSPLSIRSFVMQEEGTAVFLIAEEADEDADDEIAWMDDQHIEWYDLETGVSEMREIDNFYNSAIHFIAPGTEGRFLVYDGTISFIDADDHCDWLNIHNSNVIDAAAGTEAGQFYMLRPDGIDTANLYDRQFESWLRAEEFLGDETEAAVDLQRGGDTLYVREATSHSLIVLPLTAREERYEQTLTFVMPGYWKDSRTDRVADALFREMHPDVQLAQRNYSQEKLTTALLAGEPGLDILVLGAGSLVRTEMYTFYRAGMLANLLEHEGIARNLESWIDLTSVFGCDGGLYAVPMYQKFYANLFFMNPEIAARMGIAAPEADWTMDDLYALYDAVAQYNEQSGERIPFLIDYAYMPLLTRQYLKKAIDPRAGTARINTAEFADFLEWWKAGVLAGQIIHTRSTDRDVGFETPLLEAAESLYADMVQDYALYPPKWASTDRYPVRPIAYAVNANGALRELALDYIACLTAPEAQYAEPIELSQPLLRDIGGYAPNEGQIMMRQTYVPGYPFHFDNTRLFVDLIENGVDDSVYDFEWDFGDMILDYIDGEIELMEMLNSTQMKADMMLGE